MVHPTQPQNRKNRRLTQSAVRREPKVIFRGTSYTLNEAQAFAVKQQVLKNSSDAIEIYRLILAKDPNREACLNNLGLLLYQFEDIDQAISLYRRAIQQAPYNHHAYGNLGGALTSKGYMREAEDMLLKALSLKPDHVRSMYSLAHIRKYTSADHEDAKRILALLHKFGSTLEDLPHAYFALGKIYDDSGLYDEAFNCFRQANQILNASVAYNPDQLRQDASNIIDVFSKSFLAQSFSFGSESQQPVFIVGMPRSGTTLMANILSNHPSIKAVGELPTMPECTDRLPEVLGGDVAYPQAARNMTPAAAGRLIKYYEKHLRQGIRSGMPFIIDKHPINFRHLGLISMLFPKARIIHCTRHPLDTCLSNYFQYFDPAYDYSFDLGNIGHFYGEYARLMAHWREALPLKMIEISYEDTVMNMEKTARKTLEFLGLEWDKRCLSPQCNKQVIKTASMWQVRQPVYRQSIERWRHYEKYLDPLKKILQQGCSK